MSTAYLSPNSSRPIVLCIDDDTAVLSLRKDHLESKGFQVLSAESGPKALAMFAAHSVDCVILDYEMPGMNGCQVASAIKQSSPNIPVLMVTGASVPEHELGCVDSLLGKLEPLSRVLERVNVLLFLASHR